MNARRGTFWLFAFLALMLLANLAVAGWFFISDYRRMKHHPGCVPYTADDLDRPPERQRYICPDGSLVEKPF